MSKSTTEYHEPLILGGPLAPHLSQPRHQWDVRRLNEVLLPLGHKWCGACKCALPVAAFGTALANRNGLTAHCRACKKSREDTEGKRARTLQSTYGVSIEELETLLAAQGGMCAICGGPATRVPRSANLRFVVDHDHETGKVRGLLCGNCNAGLGQFKESIENMEKAVRYLQHHNATR